MSIIHSPTFHVCPLLLANLRGVSYFSLFPCSHFIFHHLPSFHALWFFLCCCCLVLTSPGRFPGLFPGGQEQRAETASPELPLPQRLGRISAALALPDHAPAALRCFALKNCCERRVWSERGKIFELLYQFSNGDQELF